ncbi:bifunctional riboflavin kinase/FMN phosphatase-like isoform X2 [Cynara cardunculus var. scolymus]|uniref:bifunctional riboflavin kinase/FMN phosphatase-like isoform X2 n=1 Tax=Cynara cardunculus var. scolymus TaxID=59895 RepID=UPI000D623C94|nr:bifunctional riboflavin kinase/FMN phosphatase-like isoform X2 [Cynara cardunculus var. scolymus]
MDDDRRISAVIFDLDGTLLDTEHVTKDVLKEVLVRYGKVVDLDKEKKRHGMAHRESTIAIVKDYDLPITPQQYSQIITPMYHEKWLQAKALPGVNRLIKHLRKHGVPYALASNSRRKSIEIKVSSQEGWKEYFSVIVGSEEVKSGKPSPDIFLETANKMGVDASCCLVIEDSMVGIRAGKAANMQVVAVPSIQSESDEYLIADHVIHSFLDFQPELWALPPFEDWVMKALPIEPFHFKGSYENGFLQESSDNGASDLVGQAWGVYFGWVEVDSQERLKIVVDIRWDHCCGAYRRNIACFINGSESDGQICDELMEVTLVGYIRGFCSKQNLSTDAQIVDQDKSIAEACLDLPAYRHHDILP